MVTYLGTHSFMRNNVNLCTMLLICIGNHNRLCLKVLELLQIDDIIDYPINYFYT